MRSDMTHGQAGGPMTTRQFIDAIDQISCEHSRSENFRYLMEASYCVLAKQTEPDAARAAALEARYVAVGRDFKDAQETLAYLSLLLNRLWLTVAQYRGDFLGEAYQRGGIADKPPTRYFTSYSQAETHAALVIEADDFGRRIARERPITLLDAACGCGSVVIAAAARIESLGFDPREVLLATLISGDRLSSQMAFLQMWFKGIPAVCIHEDKLTAKAFDRACTPAAFRQWQRMAESEEAFVLRSEQSGAPATSPDTSAERDGNSEQVAPATKSTSTKAGTPSLKRSRSPRKR